VKILSSYQALPVYFVHETDIVTIEAMKLYKNGFIADSTEFDFEAYDAQITDRGWPDPLDTLAKVTPNMRATKPGIEIMCNRDLFKQDGRFFYALMDAKELDSVEISSQQKIRTCRSKKRKDIDKFLEKKLYAFERDVVKYQTTLITLIKKTIKNPTKLFELHVLQEDMARWIPWNETFLEHALKQQVTIDIDWLLANKLLALYAIDESVDK